VSGRGATEDIAGWLASAPERSLPDGVRERVLLHTLDTVAAMVVGAGQPWSASARRYVEAETGHGSCTVVASTRRATPELAAFANATAAHGYEIDDFAMPGLSHPGCVVVPAALALAEERSLSGEETLRALATGFELIVRLGRACAPSLTSDRGFHVTSVFGVFGAAAVSSVAHRADAQTALAALGLAASHAGGTTEFTRTGGDVKRVHAGMAAAGGLRAAALARAGLTGPTAAIEGERGFLRAFVASPQPERLTAGLGTDWALADLAVKRWCVCGGLQAPLAALDGLLARIPVADVEGIVVGLDRASLHHVGSIGPRPRDMTEAQMSLHHALAMRAVAGGNDPIHYATADSDAVAAFGARVRAEVDPASDADFPDRLHALVTLRLRDGSTHAERASAPGVGDAQWSRDDVVAKFRALCRPVLGARSDALESAVLSLPERGVGP